MIARVLFRSVLGRTASAFAATVWLAGAGVSAFAQTPSPPLPAPSPSPAPSPEPTPPPLVPIAPEAPYGTQLPPTGSALSLNRFSPVVGLQTPTAKDSRAWALSLGVQSAWGGNIRFTPDTGQSGTPDRGGSRNTVINRGAFGLSHSRTGLRGEFSLSGSGSGALYGSEGGLSRMSYGAASSFSYRLSPRATFRLGGGANSGYAYEIPELTTQALPLPLVDTQTYSGFGGLSYKLSKRMTVSGDARYSRVAFGGSQTPGAVVFDGSSYGAGGSLNVPVSSRSSMSLAYDYQTSRTRGNEGSAQSLSLGWGRAVAKRLLVNLSGGATRFTAVGGDTAQWLANAAAGVAAQMRRGTLSVLYSRGLSQAFGFGRDRIGDVVTFGYALNPTKKLKMGLATNYGFSRDPIDKKFRFQGGNVNANLGFVLARYFDVSMTYAYRASDLQLGSTTSSHSAGVWVGYGREWRR